jgi:hypothetical protein
MATATPTTPAPTQGLRRELGLASTTSAVIGGIIAVGIFLTPAGMAKALGSPMWLLLVWLVIGAMTLSGALCFGELIRNGRSVNDAAQCSTLVVRRRWRQYYKNTRSAAALSPLRGYGRAVPGLATWALFFHRFAAAMYGG